MIGKLCPLREIADYVSEIADYVSEIAGYIVLAKPGEENKTYQCVGEECAWFDEVTGRCALTVLAAARGPETRRHDREIDAYENSH